MLGASVPLISRKSYLSSNKKSLKTRAMVSPGSARIDQVQSRLLSYSAGYPGLVIEPAVPRNVPPHAPSAGERPRSGMNRYSLAYSSIFVILHTLILVLSFLDCLCDFHCYLFLNFWLISIHSSFISFLISLFIPPFSFLYALVLMFLLFI